MNGVLAVRPPTVTLAGATGVAREGEEGAAAPSATAGLVAPRPVKKAVANAPGAIGFEAEFSEESWFWMTPRSPGEARTTVNWKPADVDPLLVTVIVALPAAVS